MSIDKENQYNETKVALEIEAFVRDGGLTYCEAICHFMEVHGIEIEESPKYIHKNILDKLMVESSDLNLLCEKTTDSKLPF